MDSEFLGDILECSVCLKPLDDENKVLPCQHTFCKSCLHSIVKSRKELRCPECRIVVRQRVEDLPSNILLIRLLDGIRSQKNQLLLASNSDKAETRRHSVEGILSEPVPASGGAKDGGMQSRSESLRPMSLHERTSSEPASSKIHVIASKPLARAIFPFNSTQSSDLSFEKGDTIHLLKKIDANWMSGECKGRMGVFPVNYVKVLQPLPSEQPSCVALFDFESDQDDHDRDCLHFSKNDRILVIRKVDENWLEGILNEKIGIFPVAFVELNNEARKLVDDMSSPAPPDPVDDGKPHRSGIFGAAARRITNNKQGGKNTKKRHSFPTFYAGKKKEDNSPSSSTSSHRHSMELSPSSSIASPIANNSSSTPVSGDAPHVAAPTVQVKIQHDSVKIRLRRREASSSLTKHSSSAIDSSSASTSPSSVDSSSVQILSEKPKHERSSMNHSKPMPTQLVTAIFDYPSQKFDELDVIKGDTYHVIEVCDDGWCSGTHLKSGKSGVFPGNYVTPSPLATSSSKSPTVSTSSSSSTPRTYEQFRQQQQQKVTNGVDKSSAHTKSASLPSPLSPSAPKPLKSVSPTPMKPLAPTSAKQGPFLLVPTTSNQTPEVVSNVVRTSASSASKLGGPGRATPMKPNASKSAAPPRPVAPPPRPVAPPPRPVAPPPRPVAPPPTKKFTSSANLPVNKIESEGEVPTSSRSLDILSYKLHSNNKDPKKTSEKNKKRDRGMLNKLLIGSSAGRKPRTPPPPQSSASPLSSPGVTNKDLQKLWSSQTQPSVKPLSRDRYRVIMSYPAQDAEELDLLEGDVVVVHSRRPDGWFKGTLQRTGKSGLFPSTFIERISN